MAMTFDDVLALASTLPGVEESTSYGTRAIKVKGKLMARLKEDGTTLVLAMDHVNRGLLLRDQPQIFFLTDHYRDYPWVLVRLSAVKRPQMRELVGDAWERVASKKPPKKK